MSRSKFIIPVLVSLLITQCGGHDKGEKISDGRSLKFEDSAWETCKDSNEIASFRIEYESGMAQVTEDSEDGNENVFKQYCHEINGAIWCETGSPADNILSSLSDDIRHKLSTCCYKANGSFFKTTPVNKYYNIVEVEDTPPASASSAADEYSVAASDTPATAEMREAEIEADTDDNDDDEPGFWARLFGSRDDSEDQDTTDNDSSDDDTPTGDVEESGGFFNGWFKDDDVKEIKGIIKETSDDETDKTVTLYHKSFDPSNFGSCHQK